MYFLFHMDRVNISSLAPVIGRELQLSAFDLGIVFSAFAYPYALFQIIGGYVGDRLGPKLTLGLCGQYKLDLKQTAVFATGIFLAGVVGDTLGGLISDYLYKRYRGLGISRLGVIAAGFALSLLFIIPMVTTSDLVRRPSCSAPPSSSSSSSCRRSGRCRWI
jgi:MFS family permease